MLRLLFILFISQCTFAQLNWISHKNKIEIPFELIYNLIIVDVKVNDVDLKMILDTGSEKNLMFSFPKNDSIAFYNPKTISIRGLGYGKELNAYISEKNKFEINGLVDRNFQVLLVTNQDISLIDKLGIQINGIIGSSFFKDFLVEINYSKKKLYLYKDFETITKKMSRYEKTQIEIYQNKPYVNLKIENSDENHNAKLLFDSGLGDGLWLFESDSIKCKERYFIDFLGRGLSGDVKGKKSRIESLQLDKFILHHALVSYPDIKLSELDLFKGRDGSLGGEIIKRFNWVLDYKNERFYYKQNNLFNEPFNYNMSGLEVHHFGQQWVKELDSFTNVSGKGEVNATEYISKVYNYKYTLKPNFQIYEVRENSPAAKAGLLAGDIIIKINNKSSHNYTIQKITELFQSEEGKKIKILVERDGKLLEFEFYLEKIL